MSHFYGTVQGHRSEATRTGSKASGVTTHAASWSGAIKTEVYLDAATGRDRFRVSQVQWHGAGVYEVIAEGFIGEPVTAGALA
jgi:hypothetical protein